MIDRLTQALLETNRSIDSGMDVLDAMDVLGCRIAEILSARGSLLFQVGLFPVSVHLLRQQGIGSIGTASWIQRLNARILDCIPEEPAHLTIEEDSGNPFPCIVVPLVQHAGQWVVLLVIDVEDRVDCDGCCLALRRVFDTYGTALRVAWRYSRYFDVFRDVSAAIHAEEGTETILQTIVRQASEAMAAQGCIFWILDDGGRRIQNSAMHGFSYTSLASVDYQTLCRLFAPNRDGLVLIEDARYESRIPDLERLGKKRVCTVLGVPVSIVDDYRGILAVYFGQVKKPVPREIGFLKALSEQGALALQRAMRYDRNMLETFRQTIEGLALAIEAKDAITHGHSQKVALFCKATAMEMGLGERQAEILYRAGLLHDIGKIGIQDRHLGKLGVLNAREYAVIQKHPQIGAAILQPLTFLDDIVPLVKYHHERFDGSGYPEGLQGEAIPLGARVLAACDCFETMISGRLYIEAVSLPEALCKLRQMAGKALDPTVVDALIRVIEHHPEDIHLSADDLNVQPPESPDWIRHFQQIF
ncbi:MAG: HD domain-containing phosphohydrolase [Thermodesulfobacteriota bacterium]